MPPPELPRDVPVADVLEPVDVHRLPALGQDAHGAVAHGLERRRGERRHLHEPLVGQARLDHGVAAVAMPHRVLVRLDLHERARLARASRRCARAPRSGRARAAPSGTRPAASVDLAHDAVGVDHDRHRQLVPLADLEVVRVVRRRDLHRRRCRTRDRRSRRPRPGSRCRAIGSMHRAGRRGRR